jgi:hypothetical protein
VSSQPAARGAVGSGQRYPGRLAGRDDGGDLDVGDGLGIGDDLGIDGGLDDLGLDDLDADDDRDDLIDDGLDALIDDGLDDVGIDSRPRPRSRYRSRSPPVSGRRRYRDAAGIVLVLVLGSGRPRPAGATPPGRVTEGRTPKGVSDLTPMKPATDLQAHVCARVFGTSNPGHHWQGKWPVGSGFSGRFWRGFRAISGAIWEPKSEEVESWKPVVGYEGLYEVSDLGRVRSVGRWERRAATARTQAYTRWRREQLVALVDNKGYPSANLWRDGRGRVVVVHRLVLEAFVGPCPEGEEGCHNDGDRGNSRLSNLRWDSHIGNAVDAVRRGVIRKGEDCHQARLTDESVREIIELAKTGLPDARIAERFGVTQSAVFRIRRGKAWRHVVGRGLGRRGWRPPTRKKITVEDARAIRAALVSGESVASVVRRYSISKTTVYAIASGERWREAQATATP